MTNALDNSAVADGGTVVRYGDVELTIAGSVALLVIDRPHALNALSPAVLTGMTDALHRTLDADCTVLVIRGRGGTLSSGADLKYLLTVLDDPDARRAYITAIGHVVDAIEAAPLISVAVVDGYAIAGGLELLLGCDLAVVSDESRLGDRHLEFGLLPGAGSSVRLTARLPAAAARRLLYLSELTDGQEAVRLGLVTASVPRSRLGPALDGLLARLGRHDRAALLTLKRLHTAAEGLPTAGLPAALVAERETLLKHLSSDAVRQGLHDFAARSNRSRGPAPTPDRPASERPVSPSASPAPVLGKWFEDLTTGLVISHAIRRTVTETDNVLLTTMSMNPAPVHLDAAYASATEFGAPLINSMFTLALVVGLSVPELTHGTIVAQLGLTDVTFPTPLFAGDTVRVESEVVSSRRSASRPTQGVVVFAHRAYNQKDELVCALQRTGLMHCRPSNAAS